MSTFAAVLARYPRVAIAGGPRTGKTSLAQHARDGRLVVHTDDFIGHGDWAAMPGLVIDAAGSGPCLIEGVQVPRALRKGLRVDAVVWLETPRVHLSPRQEGMLKGTAKVFEEWLVRRGATAVIYECELEECRRFRGAGRET